jgi:hypothetical protein
MPVEPLLRDLQPERPQSVQAQNFSTIQAHKATGESTKELQRPSRRWAERRFVDIRHWNELARGGHFAAFEQPQLFVDEVRTFFRPVR